MCQWKALFGVPKRRQRSEHISGCKCHVAAEWWKSRVFDVWERLEHNSRPAVTPFQTLMIQSMRAGGGPCAHMYRGAVVLCETIICARFFCFFFPLQMREVHIIICMSDLFLPEVHLELWKTDCDDCELFCDCNKTLSFTRAFRSAHKRYFLPPLPLSAVCWSLALLWWTSECFSPFMCPEIVWRPVLWSYVKGTWCLQMLMLHAQVSVFQERVSWTWHETEKETACWKMKVRQSAWLEETFNLFQCVTGSF